MNIDEEKAGFLNFAIFGRRREGSFFSLSFFPV
jgi:hypothetical protein